MRGDYANSNYSGPRQDAVSLANSLSESITRIENPALCVVQVSKDLEREHSPNQLKRGPVDLVGFLTLRRRNAVRDQKTK